MQTSTKRKKRGGIYFSSKKALRSSRMARMKKGKERVDTSALRKVLDFDGIVETHALDVIDERRSMEPGVGGSRRKRQVLSVDSESEDCYDDEVCDSV